MTESTMTPNTITSNTKNRKTAKKIDRTELIPIMNCTSGVLFYTSPKTGASWRLTEYGSIEEMEVSELITMRSAYPKFLNAPWILVMDDEIVEFLGLKDLYQNILFPEQLDKLFSSPINKMKQIMSSAPRGMQETIVARARELVNQKKFDSATRIDAIEKMFSVDISSEKDKEEE